MLTAVGGYYNGSQIVMDENVNLQEGQRVIITILEQTHIKNEKMDLKHYMGRGEKMFHTDAGKYVKELRTDDRI